MTQKEKLLAIKNYEEFNKRREEFRELPFDKDIIVHLSKIFPKKTSSKGELYKYPRK